MRHSASATQDGVATWTVTTDHPIPSAILDDLRQHLDSRTQVRVLLRLPGPVFTIDAALLASRRKRIHVEIIQRLDELNAVADGRRTTTSPPAATGLSGTFKKEANATQLAIRGSLQEAFPGFLELGASPGGPHAEVGARTVTGPAHRERTHR